MEKQGKEQKSFTKKQPRNSGECMKIELLKGNIAEVKADILVNAAGTSLEMGGGVAGALRRAGGKEIEEEALEHAPAELGSVVVTGAGRLRAKFVFHAAAQPHYGNFKATQESVKKAARNALKRAEELNCKSIAFPALGCGIAGLRIEEGARAMLGEIRAFEERAKSIEAVKLVLYSQKDFEAFRRELVGVIPTEKECYELLEENSVPENVVRHSEAVKDLALELAGRIRASGSDVNLELVVAGALLHDIDKIETLEEGRHGEVGWRKLRKKGYYGVADIVRKHVLEKIKELAFIEEKLVYYADKRVIGGRVVPLRERLACIRERYGSKSAEAMQRIKKFEPLAYDLEKELVELMNKNK